MLDIGDDGSCFGVEGLSVEFGDRAGDVVPPLTPGVGSGLPVVGFISVLVAVPKNT